MENERKRWEKVQMKKEIQGNLTRLWIISSYFAADLISEEELQTMIQEEISKLSLVAVITDLVYQGEIPVFCEDCKDCRERMSQKEFIEAIKEMNELHLIKAMVGIFKDRKEKYWEKENEKQENEKQNFKNNTTIEAKQMSLFFV
jgi:hypothetical protein